MENVQEIRQKISKDQELLSQAKGKQDYILKQLAENGCNSIKEASKELIKLDEKVAKLQDSFEGLTLKLEELYEEYNQGV